MNRPPQRRNPHGQGAGFESSKGFGAASAAAWSFYRKPPARLPRDWRERLPNPATYFAAHVEKLSKPNSAGWAQGRCPFHQDSEASLSVCITGTRGGWRCFAGCGAGDLLAFHVQRTGLPFDAAVRDLLGVRHD